MLGRLLGRTGRQLPEEPSEPLEELGLRRL